MLGKLRLLLKDTVIYGTSTILARGLNYVLVPLYANLLTTFENGVHSLVYANIALLNVLFAYGMETAYLKTASDALRADGDRSGYFSTGFLSLLLTSTIFATLLVLFAPVLARAIGLDAPEGEFVRYAAVILWLDALLVVPFADLRLQRRALRFAAARVTGVIAVVVSAWVMIVQMGFGLKGAFFANIAGSLVSLLLVLPVFSGLKPLFSSSRLWEMLRLGLPYVPTGIAGLLIHLIDRNVLIRMPRESIERLYGPGLEASDVVGIYGRVAAFGILLQLFIQVFRFAWQPFFLQHADDPESKPLFRQVLTLSTLFTMLVAVGATFFVPDLVQWHIGGAFYLLPPPYWIGLSVLPWIFWSYVFDMASTNLSAGILITGTTRYLPVVTFAGAAVTTAVCVGLVPVMGMDGAGVAILAGTAVMSFCMALFSLKVYPNRYEWGRLGVVLAGGVVCTRVPAIFGNESILLEAGLLLMFGALVLLVFRTEVRYVLNAVGRRRG